MTLTNRIKNAPKQQRSRETLAAILQATVEVLRDSADGSFSLREVAERAGISQGTLYARFPTRDELIEYVHLTLWDNNQAAVEAFAAAQAQTIPTGPAERAPDRATLERLVRTAIAWYAGNSSVGYRGRGWDTADWPEKQFPGGLAGVRLVAQKQPNAWGLHDMLGNVYQWCRDHPASALPGGAVKDPTGPARGADNIVRGGSWHSPAVYCRAAHRTWNNPDVRSQFIGFRIALAPILPP